MSYGKHYTIKFKNRIQNDIYRVEIWEKSFVGDTVELTGAENPFTAAYTNSDTDILTPIKPLELTISFNTDGTISIDDFYSDDDEKFRVDYYFESFADGTGTAKLLYSTYLVEDGVSEAITDFKHVITLKATDNLALLKQFKYNEVAYFDDFPLVASHPLQRIVAFILNKTNLYNLDQVIDQSLPLRIFDNLFENTTDDRSVSSTKDPFLQTILFTGMFLNDDGTWKDCYSILETILKSKNACIFQADGFWNIIRLPECNLFTDGAIKGTQYNFNGSTTDITAVTLDPLVSIERNGTELQPTNEDHTKSIQRPVKYAKNTFNYNQPKSLIYYSDLQLPAGATPFATSTKDFYRKPDGTLTNTFDPSYTFLYTYQYDDYSVATYFPFWKELNDEDSFLEVVTDSTAGGTEVERYIVSIGNSGPTENNAVQFNPIPVSKNDRFDFSLSFRTRTPQSSFLEYWIRFLLITEDGHFYYLKGGDDSFGSNDAAWVGPYDLTDISDVSFNGDNYGLFIEFDGTTQDSTQYITYTLSQFTYQNLVAVIPDDGILIIEVRGTTMGSGAPHKEYAWKDITLNLSQYVNQSTQIIGQTHTDTGNSLIKAVQENDIEIDDSPRNTIAGTLFTPVLTSFAYNIGDIYFTKTTLWHRAAISEALRLGNILAQERLRLNYTSRAIVEGTFKNLRYDTNKFVSLLSLFEFPSDPKLSGKKFIAASITLDYMACTFNARLIEILKDDEDDFSDTYLFKFLYKSN